MNKYKYAEVGITLHIDEEVTVKGGIFNGRGVIKDTSWWTKETPRPSGEGSWDRPDESFPQILVRMHDGDVAHFNGDDLAAGKVVAAESAESADMPDTRRAAKLSLSTAKRIFLQEEEAGFVKDMRPEQREFIRDTINRIESWDRFDEVVFALRRMGAEEWLHTL